MRKIMHMAAAATMVATGFALVPFSSASAIGKPTQCTGGNFCVYSEEDGKDICNQWSGNSTNWGSCANDGESFFNNGYAASYDDVNIYWGRDYSGAYACLGRGDYWLFANEEHFDHVGSKGGDGARDGSTGLGESLQNNAASHRWAQQC